MKEIERDANIKRHTHTRIHTHEYMCVCSSSSRQIKKQISAKSQDQCTQRKKGRDTRKKIQINSNLLHTFRTTNRPISCDSLLTH